MDQRLIPADPALVRRFIAEAYLASPAVDQKLGEIDLQPHQVDAASRVLDLLRAHGGAVLADATGMGKTFVALAVARLHDTVDLVAPAALRGMWQRSAARAGINARIDSYESLSRGSAGAVRWPQLLILDEAHHARNPASRRYERIAELAWGARVLILSATPIHNRGRDIRALLALFLGSKADALPDDDVRQYIVRRTSESLDASVMPALERPRWLEVPRDAGMLNAIGAIPPAVPASDGAPAHALMQLGLIRAWSSSEAALRATLRRRLRRVASFFAALESGRVPDRNVLDSWPVIDDAVQLGFPDLYPGRAPGIDVASVHDALVRHQDGVRTVLSALDRNEGAVDGARISHLRMVQQRHRNTPVVGFTQFADTAIEMFRRMSPRGGSALVTGSGARVASGPVAVEEIIRGFDVDEVRRAAMPLDMLITTDVLSEGLSLRRAAVIVHLDVPWTLARLEQRVGRLRRFGSRHRSIAVYAIGPPVASHELAPVLRVLQRKARIGTSVVGDVELAASVPLFGSRLARATGRVAQRREASAIEELRRALSEWRSGRAMGAWLPGRRALVLLLHAGRHRLLVVDEAGVSERIADVRNAVMALGNEPLAPGTPSFGEDFAARLQCWFETQRARDLVRQATDAPSLAHLGVLRALQEALRHTSRTGRALVADRVEHCRALVLSARGVGAERAMASLLRSGFTLDALEMLLSSRAGPSPVSDGAPAVAAVLESAPGHISGFIAESMHPGLPRSSSHHLEPAAARG